VDWICRNWFIITAIIPLPPLLLGIWYMIKVVVTKKYSPPLLQFQAVREKGMTPSEIYYLARITSEPLGGVASLITKRGDIRQAEVRAQFECGSNTMDQVLDRYPDGPPHTEIMANGTKYDFLLVLKSEGYDTCRFGGYTDTLLPPRTDIPVLIKVMEGKKVLGQSSCIIHNPDQHIENFTVECVA
jgi:hypothetical protein